MDSQKPSKSISTSTPSFSFRYNAEEEEVEQLFEPTKLVEAHSDNNSPQTTPVAEKKTKEKSARRSGSFEDGNDKEDKWRIFTEITGRLTKKVEEKIDDFKTERMIKKKEKKDKLKTTNSLSDSEDRSEDTSLAQASTVSNASSSPEKTKSLTVPNNDESDLGDISGSEEGSTPERPSTPTFTDDLSLQRPRPAGSQPVLDDKGRGKKGLKFKFYKKKVPETVDVEEAVEVFEEVPAEVKPLPLPRRKYRIVAHRYPWTAVATLTALLLAYFCQKPTFLSGILFGVILSFITALWSDHLYRWMTFVDPETNFLLGHYNFENIPFLSDKVIKKDLTPPELKYHKGWLNELPGEYNPQNYHISQTEPVYVKLVGSILRLCTPKGKIPKRAFCSEPKHSLKFTRERAFDIARCEVQLLPENLTNKRKWSRKYPMVIYLLPASHLGTRWAESKKNLLSDSDQSFEPNRNSPVNEIYVGNKKRDQFKWKMENLLRKLRKERPNCFNNLELEPLDNDVFFSDLETEGLDKTPRDSPIPSVGEPASKKSPAGSPTHGKGVKPPQPNNLPNKENHSKSSKSSPENSPKKVVPAQDDDSSCADPLSANLNDADDEGEDEEDDSISDFVKVSPLAEKTQIVLFARSAREKDLWYRKLVAATTYIGKLDPADEKYSEKHAKRREKRTEELRDYVSFMKSFGQFRCTYEDNTGVVTFDHTNKERENYLWLNLFLARILYDAMKQDFWIELIKSKIQKKLAVIRVPAFIEPITLAEIKFSGSVPAIEWTHNVSMNDDGIWTEVEISYQGTMTMTVYTKLNAFMLASNSQLPNHRVVERKPKTAYMDSSQEDSGETSTEELGERTAAAKTLAFIDKVGSSKIIQQLKETRFVKKAMEDVSNTPIHLNVRVNRLIGTLVLNIPPPPSDRLWYGFKPNVEIHMECKPIVGARNINFEYISNMIEKVMRSEFQKVIVMPNMDDLVIPLMSRDMPY
ncbi:hypothetical protein GE061_004779 [Apolygus lucorum]|uniref:SMP-LTD domain-containing protein n=1 Tax=Apolygus lucorum TaxID=248454 RepID=A0A8S9WZN7_APOLU|nr:hypothetical protein GE061_004779 [Apolygus lucorum]